MTDNDFSRWREKGEDGLSRMDVLWRRQDIRRAIRSYMDSEGFIEFETPLLVYGTTPDTCIETFRVGDRVLVTSCE